MSFRTTLKVIDRSGKSSGPGKVSASKKKEMIVLDKFVENKKPDVVYPQAAHLNRIKDIIEMNAIYIDTSETGEGKTFASGALSQMLPDKKVIVFGPKASGLSSWNKLKDNYKINANEPYFISYQSLTGKVKYDALNTPHTIKMNPFLQRIDTTVKDDHGKGARARLYYGISDDIEKDEETKDLYPDYDVGDEEFEEGYYDEDASPSESEDDSKSKKKPKKKGKTKIPHMTHFLVTKKWKELTETGNGAIVIFDEFHSAKNNSLTNKAMRDLLFNILNPEEEANYLSVIGFLSATPMDKVEHAFNFSKIMGFVPYHINKVRDHQNLGPGRHEYIYNGLNEMIKKCFVIDETLEYYFKKVPEKKPPGFDKRKTTKDILKMFRYSYDEDWDEKAVSDPFEWSKIKIPFLKGRLQEYTKKDYVDLMFYMLYRDVAVKYISSRIESESFMQKGFSRGFRGFFIIQHKADRDAAAIHVANLVKLKKTRKSKVKVKDKKNVGVIPKALLGLETSQVQTFIRLAINKLSVNETNKVVIGFNYIHNINYASEEIKRHINVLMHLIDIDEKLKSYVKTPKAEYLTKAKDYSEKLIDYVVSIIKTALKNLVNIDDVISEQTAEIKKEKKSENVKKLKAKRSENKLIRDQQIQILRHYNGELDIETVALIDDKLEDLNSEKKPPKQKVKKYERRANEVLRIIKEYGGIDESLEDRDGGILEFVREISEYINRFDSEDQRKKIYNGYSSKVEKLYDVSISNKEGLAKILKYGILTFKGDEYGKNGKKLSSENTMIQRDKNTALFRENMNYRIIIISIRAGSQAISLHNTEDPYKIYMYVSVSNSPIQMHQFVGRIFRYGAKGPNPEAYLLYNRDSTVVLKILESLAEKSNIIEEASKNKDVTYPGDYPYFIEGKKSGFVSFEKLDALEYFQDFKYNITHFISLTNEGLEYVYKDVLYTDEELVKKQINPNHSQSMTYDQEIPEVTGKKGLTRGQKALVLMRDRGYDLEALRKELIADPNILAGGYWDADTEEERLKRIDLLIDPVIEASSPETSSTRSSQRSEEEEEEVVEIEDEEPEPEGEDEPEDEGEDE